MFWNTFLSNYITFFLMLILITISLSIIGLIELHWYFKTHKGKIHNMIHKENNMEDHK